MQKKAIWQTFFFIISILIVSCSDNGVDPRDAKFILPESDVHFYRDIQPMLLVKCGLESGCHSSFDTENGLLYQDMVAKESLMNYRLSKTGEKLVDITDIGSPERAALAPFYLLVLEGYPDGRDRMPPYWLNKESLTDNQIEGIKTWIAEGAND